MGGWVAHPCAVSLHRHRGSSSALARSAARSASGRRGSRLMPHSGASATPCCRECCACDVPALGHPSHRSSVRRASHATAQDRKSTRLTPVTNAHLVCRLLLEKKK